MYIRRHKNVLVIRLIGGCHVISFLCEKKISYVLVRDTWSPRNKFRTVIERRSGLPWTITGLFYLSLIFVTLLPYVHLLHHFELNIVFSVSPTKPYSYPSCVMNLPYIFPLKTFVSSKYMSHRSPFCFLNMIYRNKPPFLFYLLYYFEESRHSSCHTTYLFNTHRCNSLS